MAGSQLLYLHLRGHPRRFSAAVIIRTGSVQALDTIYTSLMKDPWTNSRENRPASAAKSAQCNVLLVAWWGSNGKPYEKTIAEMEKSELSLESVGELRPFVKRLASNPDMYQGACNNV